MGVIKTALEIALEKTEKVKGDKSIIDQFEVKQKGKKLANDFLAGDIDIAAETKRICASDKGLLESLKQGIFDVLITQINLPEIKDDENARKKAEKLGKGLAFIIKSNEFSVLYKQLTQIFNQYLQEAAGYEKAIRQQYAPKLRQKEEELSRRVGREIRIDPLQDPEFVTFYNQHMKALKSNYEAVAEQAKEEITRMYNGD